MAAPVNFTPAQQEYIGNTIKLAITEMEMKVGGILGQAEAMQTEMKGIIQNHETELIKNSDRVTQLVTQANDAQLKLEGSTAKIDDADAKLKSSETFVNDLMAKLRTFEANFEEHRTQLTKLNSDTETAVLGLDVKLQSAVAATRADVQTEFNNQNEKLHIFCNGIKAEVQANVSGNGGGKGTGLDGKAGGKGSGIDKKEVAVWKLPEDVTKIQYRHWSSAVDLQLEAVHSWNCADYILNRVKRCKTIMTPESFKICLEEAAVDISLDPDIQLHAPADFEYPFAERTRFLYTYLMGKLSTDRS